MRHPPLSRSLTRACVVACATVLAVPGAFGIATASSSPTRVGGHASSAPAAKKKAKAGRVAWRSGVFTSSSVSAGALQAWGSYRGRAVDVASAFVQWDTWDQIARDTWPERAFASMPRARLTVGVPLMPRQSSGTLADVAAGKHDAQFASFAHNLVSGGRSGAIVRLGWEFDGDWVPWAAYDPATYKAAFRHVVGVIRAVAPHVAIDWCGNLGGTHVGHDEFTELYPGDDVVDIVGVDAYDRQWNPVTNAATWKHYVTMSHGLDAWRTFAVRHHKKLSLPEWGLYATETGDAAYYVQRMHTYFANHAAQIAYESYFNDPDSFIKSSLLGPNQNPRASATYASLW